MASVTKIYFLTIMEDKSPKIRYQGYSLVRADFLAWRWIPSRFHLTCLSLVQRQINRQTQRLRVNDLVSHLVYFMKKYKTDFHNQIIREQQWLLHCVSLSSKRLLSMKHKPKGLLQKREVATQTSFSMN